MIRVLVVDDSTTARLLMIEILRSDPEFTVVGEAIDGEQAVELARRLRPDLITMDIQMPRMDGFEATRRIVAEAPTAVVVVSALDTREIQLSLDGLRVGALAVLPKPAGPGSPEHAVETRRLLTTLKAMSRVRIGARGVRPHGTSPPPLPARPTRLTPATTVAVIGLAASTGGPIALRTILTALPATFPCPILVVQHIAIGFSEGFARWLDAASPLHVRVARDRDALEPGTVLLAPDDSHLGVSARGLAQVTTAPPIGGLRPSATYLFETLAASYGRDALGVVLTGMGRDGTDGLRALRAAGGQVIAQDEATCDVFGMPKAAIDAGVVDVIAGLEAIAGHLLEAAGSVLDAPDHPAQTSPTT